MSILGTIKARRSVRDYLPTPVPDEIVHQLIEAAAWAPSGSNAQLWTFIVVRKRENVHKLKILSPGIIGEPAAMIVIGRDLERAKQLGIEAESVSAWMGDGMAAQNIMLLAHELGIGSCAVRSFHPRVVQILLDLPAWIEPQLIVLLGTPAREPLVPYKRPLEEMIHWEQWEGMAPDGIGTTVER